MPQALRVTSGLQLKGFPHLMTSLTPAHPTLRRPSLSVSILFTITWSPLLAQLFSAGGRPKLHQLNSLRVSDQQLQIVQRVGVDWIRLGIALEFDLDVLKAMERSNHYQVQDCCYELLHRWLKGEACQPITWARLIEGLRDAEHAELASELKHCFTS